VSVLASIRPDSWNFPLFVHVLGAMVLVGTATVVVTSEFLSARTRDPRRLRRLAFGTLLIVGVPALVGMRVGAEWIHSKEFSESADDPTWIGIGYTVGDGGAVLLLVSLVLSGVAARTDRDGLGKAAGVVMAIALVAWLVTVWAMGAKPD
jgi:hypothetical protein